MSAEGNYLHRVAMRPTGRTWIRHSLMLIATFLTATIAGTLYPFGTIDPMPFVDPQSWGELFQLLFALPIQYVLLIGSTIYALSTDPQLLTDGLSFSISLLFILVSHEMGHYVACRIYGVDATLPYFIPTPPMIGPAGTFGAFIRIMSPMPSRKAVFDIGVAGPIAGFVALIPIAIMGSILPQRMHALGGIEFANPLLMNFLGAAFNVETGGGNPFYFAAWVGLLVTALNLIPSGQLDGGHAIYALFGKRVHFFTGRIAFVVMAALSIIGFIYFNSPSGFLIAILLGIMARIRHPEPADQTPLDAKRKLVAVLTLIIFILCFVPFPIRIS